MNSDRWTNKIPEIFRAVTKSWIPLEDWDNDVKDLLVTLIYSEVRLAYQAGYARGAEDAVTDCKKFSPDIAFSPEDNHIGGERKFLAWEKE